MCICAETMILSRNGFTGSVTNACRIEPVIGSGTPASAATGVDQPAVALSTVPQEMSENGADPAHFRYVHGTDEVAEVETYELDGPFSTMLSKQSYVTPRGVTYGRIDVYNFGPGVSKVFKLSSNENILGSSPHARAAFVAAVDSLHMYPDSRASALRAACICSVATAASRGAEIESANPA